MSPIFHLSFPVRELDESIDFYVANFSAVPGRRERNWADVALFGAQLTLQLSPGDVTRPMPRTRHFGATLPWPEWEAVTARIHDFVEAPRVDYEGSDREQAKAMVRDPSGNLIEIKAYRHPAVVLRGLGEAGS